MLHQQVLDFLSAYYPKYICAPCLATMMSEEEAAVRTSLTQATAGLQFAPADCFNCRVMTYSVRFRTGAFNGRAIAR
jgi:hypothetical protein